MVSAKSFVRVRMREAVIATLAEARKLAHLGVTTMPRRSTLSDANARRPEAFFEDVYRDLYATHRQKLLSDSRGGETPKWMEKLQIIDSTTITLFSNLIFKGAGRNPKSGKKKGGIKVHKVIRALEGVASDIKFTSAATHDSFMLAPKNFERGEMRAYQSNLVTLFKLAGPTLVSMADNTGNLTNFQMVTKHQITSLSDSPSLLFSYHAIMKDNLVHFIYTDNLTNLTTGTNEPLEIKDYSYKGKCAAHRTLDSEGHLSDPEILMDYTAYKSVLFIPLTVESDGLWIYHSEKNNAMVSWLPHNF